ncbi:MAG TPA: ABC transporter permease subunit [Bryobacteraceae bacterium]|nr:ABC transporter permease subunit [Bryobacteraceae bacterium]
MNLLRIHAQPGRAATWTLSWFLFAAGVALYFYTAQQRHRENPDDRVTPSVSQMVQAFKDAVSKPSEEVQADDTSASQPLWERIRTSMLWTDSVATGRRFLISVALLFPAVLLGLQMAMFPYIGAFFLRFCLFFDKIVALSLLPILFIAFGIDELSKIMLIVIGVAPTIILDTYNLSKSVPSEQIVKGFTLGADDQAITYRIVLPQIMPRILNGIRLQLKTVMCFLFAGEMIASTDGLAYRIALLRRHMGMDTILPYVLWVALLLFLVDLGMNVLNRKLHPWFQEA